jgi:hypothetical protein
LRRDYTPDAIVEAGDKIEIERVAIEGEKSGLHHEHDVQRRLAYIKIVKPSGSTQYLREPIVFTGALATWTGGYAKILDKINKRLCSHFDIESLLDPGVVDIARRGALADAKLAQGLSFDAGVRRDAADAEAALLHAAILARMDLKELLRQYRRTADRRDRMLVEATIRSMIDEACLVGYRWARAEADLRMRPLAEGGLRSRTAAPKGGHKSGVSRREKAEETWKPRALQWAREERKTKPFASREAIVGAMKIRATKDDWLPSEGWLLKYLGEKEASGELPTRQKKTRIAPKKRK